MATDRRIAWLLFGFVLSVLALCAHGYIENNDGDVEFLTARAIWRRGDPGLMADAPDSSAREVLVVTAPNKVTGRPGFDVMVGRGGKSYSWFGIGHAALEVPLYGLGCLLAAWFPDAEARWLAAARAELPASMAWLPQEEPFQRLCVSFLSPLCGAAIAVVLFWIARTVGAASGHAALAALCGVFATQLWPQTRESLSDTQGCLFFLLAVLGILRWWIGAGSRGALVLAGAAAGMAVLTRVQHGVGLTVVGVLVVVTAVRRRQIPAVASFVAAGLPFAAVFFGFNYWRFGDALESGYGKEAAGKFWHGDATLTGLFLVSLLWSPAKGVLWFTPALWAVPRAWRGVRGTPAATAFGLAALLFLTAWVPPALTHGWHSGWTWGCRFLTPVAVLLTVVALAAMPRPWPRWVRGLVLLGCLFSLGGVLAPVQGYLRLLFNSVRTAWPQVPEQHRQDYVFTFPIEKPVQTILWSPLLGHWRYVSLDLRGTLAAGEPRAIHEAFGWPAATAFTDPPFPLPEDIAFRHLWGITVRNLAGAPSHLAALGLAALAGFFATALLRAARPPDP